MALRYEGPPVLKVHTKSTLRGPCAVTATCVFHLHALVRDRHPRVPLALLLGHNDLPERRGALAASEDLGSVVLSTTSTTQDAPCGAEETDSMARRATKAKATKALEQSPGRAR